MKKVRKFKCISINGTNTRSGGFRLGEDYELYKEDCNDDTYGFYVGKDIRLWGDFKDFEEVTEKETLELKVERLKKELEESENALKEKRNFKVGDYVVLVSERPSHWNNRGAMDYLLNQVVEITGRRDKRVSFRGEDEWFFNIMDIERKATSEEIESAKPKLPKLPVISGHKGELTKDGKSLHYGCAIIPVEWFSSSVNRHIKNLTLSSGINISTPNMDAIRKYLEQE